METKRVCQNSQKVINSFWGIWKITDLNWTRARSPLNIHLKITKKDLDFKKAYNEYGLFADESLWITDIRATLPAYHQYRGEQQLAEDEEKIIEFIQKHPEIDSYFAVEYSLARIVYTCLRKLGLQEKCPVVCFDGSDNIVQESMFTHVKQDEKEIGSLSVRILADEIRGDDEVKTVLVPYHIREMTKTAMD